MRVQNVLLEFCLFTCLFILLNLKHPYALSIWLNMSQIFSPLICPSMLVFHTKHLGHNYSGIILNWHNKHEVCYILIFCLCFPVSLKQYKQGRSDGGVYWYIYPPKSLYLTNFYVVTGCLFSLTQDKLLLILKLEWLVKIYTPQMKFLATSLNIRYSHCYYNSRKSYRY